MDIVLTNDEVVVKAFNNNIVLVNVNDTEKILFGKGIGFGKKEGSIVEKGTVVNKIFVIEEEDNRKNLIEIIKQTDEKFFGLCEEAIYEISNDIDGEFNENIHVGLIDHLFLAFKRIKNNEKIENPFLIQIKTLYSKECNLARKICAKLEQYYNIKIPEDEEGFVALHIHSAIHDKKIGTTMKNNYLGNRIVEYVEEQLGITIDKRSLDYARFLTHIRFAIQRIIENTKTINELNNLVKITFRESYDIAKKVAKIIEDELKVKVDEEETAFLAIHIERFKISKNNNVKTFT